MYKVISSFQDAETNKVYNVGDTYTNENETRLASLVEQHFIAKEEEIETREVQQATNQEVQDRAKTVRNQATQTTNQQAQQTQSQQQAQSNDTVQQQNQARGKKAKETGE
jgi:hypothetical protein